MASFYFTIADFVTRLHPTPWAHCSPTYHILPHWRCQRSCPQPLPLCRCPALPLVPVGRIAAQCLARAPIPATVQSCCYLDPVSMEKKPLDVPVCLASTLHCNKRVQDSPHGLPMSKPHLAYLLFSSLLHEIGSAPILEEKGPSNNQTESSKVLWPVSESGV